MKDKVPILITKSICFQAVINHSPEMVIVDSMIIANTPVI